MTTREIVARFVCRQCGAPAGERCRPRTVLIGVHLERLLAAGGRRAEYSNRGARVSDTEVPFQ